MDAADLGTFVAALVTALGGREAVGWWLRSRKRDEDPKGERQSKPERAAESVVTRSEHDEAVADAVWKTDVRGKLDTILANQDAHAKEDTRRFDEIADSTRDLRARTHKATNDLMEHDYRLRALEGSLTPIPEDRPAKARLR